MEELLYEPTYTLSDIKNVAEHFCWVANELGINQVKVNVSYLKGIVDALSEDWLPIDYSQADSGKGCFDSRRYVFKLQDGELVIGSFILEGLFYMPNAVGIYEGNKPTHYRPIPAGWCPKEANSE